MNTAQSNIIEKHPNSTPNKTNPCVNYSPETEVPFLASFVFILPQSTALILPLSCKSRSLQYSLRPQSLHQSHANTDSHKIPFHSCSTVFVLMVLHNSLMTYCQLHPVSPPCNIQMCSIRSHCQTASAKLSLFSFPDDSNKASLKHQSNI